MQIQEYHRNLVLFCYLDMMQFFLILATVI